MGDYNGDLGNALGDRGHYDPNVHGLKLIEFANFLNLCPVNLLANCSGPLETSIFDCGRYKSTIKYIFLPDCLSDKIVLCKTSENGIDNTSDHLPMKLQFNYCNISVNFRPTTTCLTVQACTKLNGARFLTTRLNHVMLFLLIKKLSIFSMND